MLRSYDVGSVHPLHRHPWRHGHHESADDPFEAGGHRRRRLFDGGELRLVLLKLIAEQPRHGYELIRAIEARSGGAYAPSPGAVYPTITLLLDTGLIEESGAGATRKAFAASAAGRAHLAQHEAEIGAALGRLQALADLRAQVDAAPVVRAMQNLKTALRNRLSQDGVEKSVALDVADLIDEAARKIERL
jgi:DNA-binding PadR family transcriptional regulator